MSGVYIKGMEMQDSCYECPINKDDGFGYFTCGVTKNECDFRKLPCDCPLVPVPDHGRLIDADALYTRMGKAHTDWREHPERYNDVIPVNADEIFVLTEAVVIPADKESGE